MSSAADRSTDPCLPSLPELKSTVYYRVSIHLPELYTHPLPCSGVMPDAEGGSTVLTAVRGQIDGLGMMEISSTLRRLPEMPSISRPKEAGSRLRLLFMGIVMQTANRVVCSRD
jgi:hypothetical protein